MSFHRIEEHDLELFYVLNPNPADFATATEPYHLPSHAYKPELPTLVLVHSSASDTLHYARQFADPRITNNFNLFGVDCMFNGWSKGPSKSDKLTLEDSADFLISVLDTMPFSSYTVIGEAVHGCNVAAWIAVKRSNKVTSLILASPGYRQEAPDVLTALASVRQDLLCNKIGNGGDDTGTFPDVPLDDMVAYFIGSLDRLADARAEMRVRFQSRYGRGQPFNDVDWLFEAVMARKSIPDEQLQTVKCPVLLLRGSEDTIVSPERACEEWRRALSNASVTCHTIASAPSLISLSDKGIVNRIISQFCLRVVQ